MKRLDRIEEEKLKMNRRLNCVEEDISDNNESCAFIKEDNQNEEVRVLSDIFDYWKEDLESDEDNQEDISSDEDLETFEKDEEESISQVRVNFTEENSDQEDEEISVVINNIIQEDKDRKFEMRSSIDEEKMSVCSSTSELSISFSTRKMQYAQLDLSASSERESPAKSSDVCSVVHESSDSKQKSFKNKLSGLKKRCSKLFRR